MANARIAMALILGVASIGCATSEPAISKRREPAITFSPTPEKPKLALSEIDLSKIGRIAPKGRVQDREYNQLEIVDQLIANGKESIPYLISKLEVGTLIQGHVMDFWYSVAVGDVALIILSDFSIDPTYQETIPGAKWDNFLERRSNRNIAAEQLLDGQVAKYGRRGLKAKWQKIWTTYKDRLFWDETQRCFKVA